MNIEFDKNCYNPIYWHIKKYIADPKIRYIHIFGGSSAGKTFTITQILSETILTEDVNIKVFRKESTTLWDTVYKDFEYIVTKINRFIPFFKILDKWINRGNYQIKFGGLDDSEKAKGLSQFKYIFLNEISKFLFNDYKEIKRRMRGIVGQTCICDTNPVSEDMWLKLEVIDKDVWIDLPNVIEDSPGFSQLSEDSYVKINEAGNTILIKTTYKDNFWVVGHPIEGYGMIDEPTLQEFEWMQKFCEYDYMVYGRGEFGSVRTGNEFWRAFQINTHVKPVKYDDKTTIHVSIDNNVTPYIAVSIWQVFTEEKKIKQIHEIKCDDPNNTASRAGLKVVDYLQSINYNDVVFIYGDASTKNRNTIDEQKRSFYDLFEQKIKEKYQTRDCVPRSNTSVVMKGEFINALYSGWQDWDISINETCRISIGDYIDVKTAADGTMLKKKITDKNLGVYEKNGHFSDTKKDFICECLNSEFQAFQDKSSGHRNYEVGDIDNTGY